MDFVSTQIQDGINLKRLVGGLIFSDEEVLERFSKLFFCCRLHLF